MPKFLRFVTLILLISVLFGTLGSVFAQETMCLDLSEADCELYTELSESLAFPHSSSFEMSVEGNVAGATPAPVEFSVQATGAYVFSQSDVDTAVETLEAVPVLDVSLGDFIDFMDSVLGAFDTELNVQLTLPPDMGGSAFGPFDFWLVDGVGYMDMTPLAMISGDQSMTGVMGVDLFDFVEVPLAGVTMGDLFAAMEGMGGGFDSGDFDMSSGENPFENFFNQMENQLMNQITEEELAGFVSIQRLPDETIGNTTVVVFQTTVDIAAVFSSPAIRDQLIAQMETQMAMQGQEMPEDMDIETILTALGKAMVGSTVTVTEKFDAEAGYGLANTIVLDLTLNPAPLNEIDDSVGMTETLEMDFTIETMRTDINTVDSIEAPANAQIIPVEALLGGGF